MQTGQNGWVSGEE